MAEKLARIEQLCADVAASERELAAKRKRLRRAIFAAWRAGATQDQIADVMGVTRQRVNKIIGEDGRNGIDP